jgi:hypothetical protein
MYEIGMTVEVVKDMADGWGPSRGTICKVVRVSQRLDERVFWISVVKSDGSLDGGVFWTTPEDVKIPDGKIQLKVGDKFYLVCEHLSGFGRKKISMTDEYGIEWYRYNKPIRSYTIEEWSIVGRGIFALEGRQVPCDWFTTGPVLYCSTASGGTQVIPEEDLKMYIDSAEYYFASAAAAQAHIDATMLKEKDF